MINKEDFYLKNIELCKQLEPIMKRLGVEEDRYLHLYKEQVCGIPKGSIRIKDHEILTEAIEEYPTWRSDSMGAALPEWVARVIRVWAIDQDYLFVGALCNAIPDFKDRKGAKLLKAGIKKLFEDLITSRGQPKLEALANLIILLDSEGLLEVKE